MIETIERRSEKRFDIGSINLPFLGTREEDHSCFQYIIVDMSRGGIKFVVPNWVVNREKIQKDDVINFHLPLHIKDNYYNQSVILWTKWDEALQGEVCGARLSSIERPQYPAFISIEPASISVNLDYFDKDGNLLCNVIKDAAFLKKGIDIYLEHLIIFFSRISGYPQEEYPQLRESLLVDIHNRVKEHCAQLEELYEKIRNKTILQPEVAKYIDLEELRSIIESEIYIEIFRIAFSNESVMSYLNAIKNLEKRLYSNYNTVVLLYIHSL
jgi:hypothetical protein